MDESLFKRLAAVDCSEHTEKKPAGGNKYLTYLSWSWAWNYFKSEVPDATYEVKKYCGKPYLFDTELGYMVETSVTANGETLSMQLPVMDNHNAAMLDHAYDVATKFGSYTVEKATMFDINTSIMRCLTKNLAMFGLGIYIYSGEDLPEGCSDEEKDVTEATNADDLNKCLNQYFEKKKRLQESLTRQSNRISDKAKVLGISFDKDKNRFV